MNTLQNVLDFFYVKKKTKQNGTKTKKNIFFQPEATKKDCLSSQLILPARRLNLERQSVTEPCHLINYFGVRRMEKKRDCIISLYLHGARYKGQ